MVTIRLDVETRLYQLLQENARQQQCAALLYCTLLHILNIPQNYFVMKTMHCCMCACVWCSVCVCCVCAAIVWCSEFVHVRGIIVK